MGGNLIVDTAQTFKLESAVYRHEIQDCNVAQLLSGNLPSIKERRKKSEFKCDICYHVFDISVKLTCHRANMILIMILIVNTVIDILLVVVGSDGGGGGSGGDNFDAKLLHGLFQHLI